MATNSFVSEDSRNSIASVAIGSVLVVGGVAALLLVTPEIAAGVVVATVITSAGQIGAGSALLLANTMRSALEEMSPTSTNELQWNAFNRNVMDIADINQLIRSEIIKSISENPVPIGLAVDVLDLIKVYSDVTSRPNSSAALAKFLADKTKTSVEAVEKMQKIQSSQKIMTKP